MNNAQARHATAMAKKNLDHIQRMQWGMLAVRDMGEYQDPTPIPVERVKEYFEQLHRDWAEIESVERDMLGALEGMQ